MQTKIVGVRFSNPEGTGYNEKVYYYKDSVGCKVDDLVVAETYKGPQVVKVVCINCEISEDILAGRELKHILSKVDSTYIRATEKYEKNKVTYDRVLLSTLNVGLMLFNKYDIILALRTLALNSDKIPYDFVDDINTLEKLHREIEDYENRCK